MNYVFDGMLYRSLRQIHMLPESLWFDNYSIDVGIIFLQISLFRQF